MKWRLTLRVSVFLVLAFVSLALGESSKQSGIVQDKAVKGNGSVKGTVAGINFQSNVITLRQDDGKVIDVSIAENTTIVSRADGKRIDSIENLGVGSQVVIRNSPYTFKKNAEESSNKQTTKNKPVSGEKNYRSSKEVIIYRGIIEPTMYTRTAINTATNKPVQIGLAIPDIPGDMSQLLFGIILTERGVGDYPENYDPNGSIDMIEPSSASKWHLYDMSDRESFPGSGKPIIPRKPFKAEVILKAIKRGKRSVWEVQNITESPGSAIESR